MFAWRYLNVDGVESGVSDPFHDRDEAESWMGDSWSDLRASGIEAVELVDLERDWVLYRMGLGEA